MDITGQRGDEAGRVTWLRRCGACHAWSSQLNPCIIPPSCSLSALSHFPGRHHRPGIKGSGDRVETFVRMFYSCGKGQPTCKLPNTAPQHLTSTRRLFTAFTSTRVSPQILLHPSVTFRSAQRSFCDEVSKFTVIPCPLGLDLCTSTVTNFLCFREGLSITQRGETWTCCFQSSRFMGKDI